MPQLTPLSFNLKFYLLEVISLAKITTIADALKCASKVKAGKACTVSEMRSTIELLDTARKTALRTARATKQALVRSDNMVSRLMGKIGL